MGKDSEPDKPPVLILIGGPSGAGKTSFAAALARACGISDVTLVALDSYYRDLSHLPPAQRAMHNFDAPEAIDWPLIESQISLLLHRRPAGIPKYDFAQHVRETDCEHVQSKPFLIIEGLLALYSPVLRNLSSLLLYVDAPDEICFVRRQERDVLERGRTLASVRTHY